jgi:hypothetical protein
MFHSISWLLASVVAQFGEWSGWRLDVLFVRAVRAGVVFVGVAITVSPPVAQLDRADIRMNARAVIDTVGYAVEETDEWADVQADNWFGAAA